MSLESTFGPIYAATIMSDQTAIKALMAHPVVAAINAHSCDSLTEFKCLVPRQDFYELERLYVLARFELPMKWWGIPIYADDVDNVCIVESATDFTLRITTVERQYLLRLLGGSLELADGFTAQDVLVLRGKVEGIDV